MLTFFQVDCIRMAKLDHIDKIRVFTNPHGFIINFCHSFKAGPTVMSTYVAYTKLMHTYVLHAITYTYISLSTVVLTQYGF